jgi:DUF1009 family protein
VTRAKRRTPLIPSKSPGRARGRIQSKSAVGPRFRGGERGRDNSPIGIICGGGAIPPAVARAVQAQGRKLMLFPLYGFADKALERFPHRWVHLGAIGRLLRVMREAGCKDIVMIGNLTRPSPWKVRLDFTTLLALPRFLSYFRGGDNRLLSGVTEYFEARGFRLVGAHEVAPEILMPEGVVGKHRPRPADEDDIRFGFDLLRSMGAFDVGQAAIISGMHALAVEAAEGTASMIARVAEMRKSGRVKLPARAGVLVKAPKPDQDRRFDLPAIGPDTVAQAKAAGLSGIAVEAGSTIVADTAALVRAADKAGIFVVGVAAPRKKKRG